MRGPFRWFSVLLLGFFLVCSLGSLAAWVTLLSTICSSPRKPAPETEHVIAYSCHGTTVFISGFENTLLHWLIPAELLFMFLSVLAAAMVVLASANVRIGVTIRIEHSKARPDHHSNDD